MSHDKELMRALDMVAKYINAALKLDKEALKSGPFAGLFEKSAEKADAPPEPMTAEMRDLLVQLQDILGKILSQGQTEKSASVNVFDGLLENQFARRQ